MTALRRLAIATQGFRGGGGGGGTVVVTDLVGTLADPVDLTGAISDVIALTGAVVEFGSLTGAVEDVTEQTGAVAEPVELAGRLDCAPASAFEITSFSSTSGAVEIGASVVTPGFTAAYSQTPTLARLDDSDGNPSKIVTSTPTAFASDETFQKTANNATVTFTLTAERSGSSDTSNAAIAWRPRTYWGLGGASLLTEAEIEALGSNQLDSNFAASLSFAAAGPAEYGWYCFPQSYDPGDAATFTVGQFTGGWAKLGAVSVTNANGVTQDYACWRTDYPGLGAYSVVVA